MTCLTSAPAIPQTCKSSLQAFVRVQIMLKDLADSKRLNASIKQLPATPNRIGNNPAAPDAAIDNMTATILSELFWPALPQESISMPHEVHNFSFALLTMILKWADIIQTFEARFNCLSGSEPFPQAFCVLRLACWYGNRISMLLLYSLAGCAGV